MKEYELVVILHPDLEIDVDAPVSKIEKLITAADGKIVKKDNWGKKRLTYAIKKQQFGVYIYMEVDLEPDKVRQLESTLRITEEVMRFLLVKRVAPQPVISDDDKSEDSKNDKKNDDTKTESAPAEAAA